MVVSKVIFILGVFAARGIGEHYGLTRVQPYSYPGRRPQASRAPPFGTGETTSWRFGPRRRRAGTKRTESKGK